LIETSPEEGVRFESVVVEYGATRALNDLTLSLRRGEIVGLLGHNGAGKSTLVNVATGAARATSGRMLIDGVETKSKTSPGYLASLGVNVIHQEPALAINLTVGENLFLGRKTKLSGSEIRSRGKAALEALGLSVSLDRPVSTLPLGQRQLVDLARSTLIGKVKALFLDEPTAALGSEETARLHELIRGFAKDGAAVAYVSHRLADVLDVCDRVVVLRNGALVLDRPIAGFTTTDLARALAPEMQVLEYETPKTGRSRVEIPDRGVSFAEGEVVGLFGMAGGDQFDLLEGLYGLGNHREFTLDGKRFSPSHPRDALRNGIHMVPADRERHSLAAGLSAVDNVYLPWLKKHSHPVRGLDKSKMRASYLKARAKLNIVGPQGEAPIRAFSGGNRQKHVIARWISAEEPSILLLAQPTQGVDVGARVDIVRALRELTAKGKTVIVASAEADEIATLCDRAYVVDRNSCVPVARSEHFEEDLVDELLSLVDREKRIV
jgi:ABC-type sugar transport system ATPase subunit